MSMEERVVKELRELKEIIENYGFVGQKYARTVGEAAVMIRELVDKGYAHNGGWIPVSERLPDNSDCVLIQVNGKYSYITFEDASEIGIYTSDCSWILVNYPEWDNPDVVAWMPLPEPYKEGVKNEADRCRRSKRRNY